MYHQGKVTLWVGRAPSEDVLRDYVAGRSSEVGDSIPSEFDRAFAIDYDEPMAREVFAPERPESDLRALLAGISYEETVVPRLVALIGSRFTAPVDAVVLLYDYEHRGPHATRGGDVHLWVVAVVDYE